MGESFGWRRCSLSPFLHSTGRGSPRRGSASSAHGGRRATGVSDVPNKSGGDKLVRKMGRGHTAPRSYRTACILFFVIPAPLVSDKRISARGNPGKFRAHSVFGAALLATCGRLPGSPPSPVNARTRNDGAGMTARRERWALRVNYYTEYCPNIFNAANT